MPEEKTNIYKKETKVYSIYGVYFNQLTKKETKSFKYGQILALCPLLVYLVFYDITPLILTNLTPLPT